MEIDKNINATNQLKVKGKIGVRNNSQNIKKQVRKLNLLNVLAKCVQQVNAWSPLCTLH